MGTITKRLTYANVVATLALFLALTGGVVLAAGQIGSRDIAKNAVKSKHVKDGQIKSPDVADDSLTGADVLESSLQLPPGAQPDSAQQVLEKLRTVDGSGSSLDADQLDGLNSTAFLGANAKAADSDQLDGLDSAAFQRTDVGAAGRSTGGGETVSAGNNVDWGAANGFFRYHCGSPGFTSLYYTPSGGPAEIWYDTGAADPTHVVDNGSGTGLLLPDAAEHHSWAILGQDEVAVVEVYTHRAASGECHLTYTVSEYAQREQDWVP